MREVGEERVTISWALIEARKPYTMAVWSRGSNPALPLSRCVIVGKLLNLSVLQFSHLRVERE